jgi:ABC-type branched-subunit amino acid transport system substrate-binding protein
MEKRKKRILAIVLIIVVVNTATGLGIWFLLDRLRWFLSQIPPDDSGWSYKDAPGAPPGIDPDQIIKIGVAGDMGEIYGDGAYEGTYYAAKEVNLLTAQGKAGGIYINSTPYYVGLTREDTDESSPNLVVARGVTAAENLINKGIQFALGGFRSEALSIYREVFMDEKIIFLSTGAATDFFCSDVKDFYARYKYFFRYMPINSTSLGAQIFSFLLAHLGYLNATVGAGNIDRVGIIYEDLAWTQSLVNLLNNFLPINGYEIAEEIAYDITLNEADMLTYMNILMSAGCDVVIPLISAQGGIMMMQHYADLQPDFIVIGIDVQSQSDTFWAQSGGDCAYETIMQSTYNTNKTSTTKSFWAGFRAEFGYDPLYTASGSYDALNALIWAINETKSFDAELIIAQLETATKSAVIANPQDFPPSVGGLGAIWPNSHDLVAGYPYGYTLFCQWANDGTKHIVTSLGAAGLYPDGSLENIQPLQIPPWVTFT